MKREKRTVNIGFNKGGTGGLSPRMSLPITWIRELGITPEKREAYIYKLEDRIIISKKELDKKLDYEKEILSKRGILNGLHKMLNSDFGTFAYDCIPEEYFEDKYFLMEAIEIDPDILSAVPNNLIDRDLAEMAIRRKSDSIFLTPFKNDRELIIKALKKNGFLLRRFEEYRNDFEIVKTAVERNGLALEYASDEMKGNFEIVKTAVSCDTEGGAIKFASDELRKNKELVILAYKKGGYRLRRGIPKELLNDIDVQRAIVSNPDNFDLLPKEVQEKYITVENLLKNFNNVKEM